MDPLVAVTAHIAAGLVLVAGAGKTIRPAATRDALVPTGLPAAVWSVRLLGAGEILLAGAVLVVGGRAAFALLTAAYVGFLAVAEHQRRAGGGCACFGASSTTAGPIHLGVDAIAALAAGLSAWHAVPGLGAVLPPGVAGATTLGLVVLAVLLTRLTLTALPELLSVRASVTGATRA